MGLWWKKSYQIAPEKGCIVTCDSSSMSKCCPILWRFGQNWTIFEFEKYKRSRVFFQDVNGVVMECRDVIASRFVGLRVGPRLVKFWAVTLDGEVNTLSTTASVIPGFFCPDNRARWRVEKDKRISRSTTFI